MRPRTQRLLHALWSLVLLACAPPPATGPETHEVREALAPGVDCTPAAATGPDTLDIASAALGEDRRVDVHLPASYAWETERRYPVLYLLDGQTHGEHAVASSEFLAAQGQLPELIIDGLRALYAGYALPEDLAASGLSAVDAHYAALSARLGAPVATPRAALTEVGARLLDSGRVSEAITVLERAARENPGSANAWNNLAEALDRGARLEDALHASRRAVELATRFDLPHRASLERTLLQLQQRAGSAAPPRAD